MKYLIIGLLFLMGCQGEGKDCCSPRSPAADSFTLSLKDSTGQDLLNPNVTGSYNQADEVRLFYFDVEKQQGRRLAQSPNEFQIVEKDGLYTAQIRLENGRELKQDGLIRWNAEETDTLQLKYRKQAEYFYPITEIWYNSIKVWHEEMGKPNKHFELIKTLKK